MGYYPTIKVITDQLSKTPISYYTTFFRVMGIESYKIWKILKPKVYDLKHFDFKRKIPPFIAPTLEDMTAYWGIREDEVLTCISEFSVLEEDLQEAFKDQFAAFMPYKNLDRIDFHPLWGSAGIGTSGLISQDQKTLIIFSHQLHHVDPRLIIGTSSYQPQFFDILFSHGRHLVVKLRSKENKIIILTAQCYPIRMYSDNWVPPEHVQQLLHKHLMTLDRCLSEIIKILFDSVLYKQDITKVVSYLYTTYKDKELMLRYTNKTCLPQILRYQAGTDFLELQITPKLYLDIDGRIFNPVGLEQHLPDSLPSFGVKLFINNQLFHYKEFHPNRYGIGVNKVMDYIP